MLYASHGFAFCGTLEPKLLFVESNTRYVTFPSRCRGTPPCPYLRSPLPGPSGNPLAVEPRSLPSDTSSSYVPAADTRYTVVASSLPFAASPPACAVFATALSFRRRLRDNPSPCVPSSRSGSRICLLARTLCCPCSCRLRGGCERVRSYQGWSRSRLPRGRSCSAAGGCRT